MKYAVVGLTVAVVLAGLVGLLGWVAYAGEVADASSETRLRARLSTPEVDPFNLSVADFRRSSERTRFSTEVRTANIEDLRAGRGAPNVDGAAPRQPLEWFHSLADGASLAAAFKQAT